MIAVIGVGNPYRRDDGVGPAVVAALAEHDLPGVQLTSTDGEPSRMLDAWAGADLAVVVDAVRCEPAEPGRIHRTGTDWLTTDGSHEPAAGAGTHGLGIPDAVRLGVALDRAPARLVVLAVEAGDVGYGVGLSEPVAAALPALTRAVLAEVGRAGSVSRAVDPGATSATVSIPSAAPAPALGRGRTSDAERQ